LSGLKDEPGREGKIEQTGLWGRLLRSKVTQEAIPGEEGGGKRP